MSVFQTTFSNSLRIYPSQYPIPSPNILASGTQIDEGFTLMTPKADFKSNGVSVGDIVYYDYEGTTYVTQVTLIINEGFVGVADYIPIDSIFVIYQQSAMSGLGNRGCYLWSVNESGALIDIETISGSSVLGLTLGANQVAPVQAAKLLASSNVIYALW